MKITNQNKPKMKPNTELEKKLLDALQRLLGVDELAYTDLEPATREAIQNAVDLVTPFETKED
jgi:hypothetical protein